MISDVIVTTAKVTAKHHPSLSVNKQNTMARTIIFVGRARSGNNYIYH
jgi:hypothetical protein